MFFEEIESVSVCVCEKGRRVVQLLAPHVAGSQVAGIRKQSCRIGAMCLVLQTALLL